MYLCTKLGQLKIRKKSTKNSTRMGMLVNQKKTQLICLASTHHSEVKSFIDTSDGRINESGENLTLLGFRFGLKPNVAAHLDLIREKFSSRSWMLRHLKKSVVPDPVSYTHLTLPTTPYV